MSVVPQPTPKRKSGIHPFLIIIIIVVVVFGLFVNVALQNARQAAQKASGQSISEPSAEDAAKATADKKTTETLAKVQLINPRIELDVINQPELLVTVKNTTDKAIDAIAVAGKVEDNFGDPVSGWGKDTFHAKDQTTLKAGASVNDSWSLSGFNNATKVSEIKVVRIHFVDGTDIQDPSYANQ